MLRIGMGLGVAVLFALAATAHSAPVTALAPSQPGVELKNGKAQDEVDVLIALMDPFERSGVDMDMPQFFAAMYYPQNFNPDTMQPELRNLLGDVEEIRYLDKKAWGANVAIDKPGLYQFILEAKPWWDAERNIYLHQQAKVLLPALGVENGWNTTFGQSFEILPLNRPFGLTAPALFSGRLLLDGKPLENIPIRMGRINTASAPVPTRWHRSLEARSDSDGQFSFVLNEPGWWYCEAAIAGAPLKGPDGEMRDLERSTVLWLYVDAPMEAKTKK